MLVVSYYTPLYKPFADRLKASCKRFGIRPRIKEWKDRGSWEENCAGKGGFVANMLREHGEHVLWLDADCELQRPIDELEAMAENHDIGVCEFIRQTDDRKFRLRSGTVLFCNTPDGQRLADRWAELCAADPKTWDQEHLFTVLEDAQASGARIAWIPRSFCFIFDENDPIPDPHIIQYQGSREYRRHHAANP
jgi:putative hemolysin